MAGMLMRCRQPFCLLRLPSMKQGFQMQFLKASRCAAPFSGALWKSMRNTSAEWCWTSCMLWLLGWSVPPGFQCSYFWAVTQLWANRGRWGRGQGLLTLEIFTISLSSSIGFFSNAGDKLQPHSEVVCALQIIAIGLRLMWQPENYSQCEVIYEGVIQPSNLPLLRKFCTLCSALPFLPQLGWC